MSYNSPKYNSTKYNIETALSLTVETYSYSLNLTDIILTLRRLAAETYSYSLSFTDVNMQEPRRITCETYSYSLGLTDIDFIIRRLTAETYSYSLSLTDVTLQPPRRLTTETYSYSLSLTDVTLQPPRRLTAETYSYSLTLTDATFDIKIPLETYSYSLSLTDIDFIIRRLAAETYSYSLTLTDATFDIKMPVETYSYSLTLTDATFDIKVPAETYSYSLSLTDATFDIKMPVETYSYSLSLTDATLTYYSGIVPHNVYVLSKTPQGKYLKHKIESGKLNITWPMPTATLKISKFVPPDSLCTVYINQTTKVFEGVSIDCPKDGRTQQYELELLGHISPFIPDPPKAGLYLGKYTWENIQLQYILGSNKPTDNNNELGIIYMANGILFDHLFELYDSENCIYSWTYYGTTYTISEVFEDVTLMTERANVTELESNSGWYHDTSTNTFYVRTSDDLSPYYHVITTPNIWDSSVPIRLGYIKDQSTTEITYEECAYGDKPLDLIEEILYALGLEYEISIKGETAYINIAETVGRGSYNNPAMTFLEGTNIEQIRRINIANGRYLTNTVAINGYGSGPSQIRSAVHRNMGRGGKFVFINNASMYSETTALNYATEYLNEMYLPQKEIVFKSNVYSKDIPTQKFVGDIVNIQIDSEKIDQLLRIQKIDLDLKNLSAEFTLSDKLITLDQRRNALEKAIEKFVNHLEDTQESYQWNWEINVDDGLARTSTFSIDDDVVSFQKLDIDISYKNWESDAGNETGASGIHQHGGATGTGGSAHSDHLTGPDEIANASTDSTFSVSIITHTHNFISQAPSETTSVSASTHTHTVSVTASASTTTIATYNHTHAVSVSADSSHISTVSTSAHSHSVSVTASASTTTVPTSAHTHSINALSLNTSSSNQASVPLTFGVGSCTATNCTSSFYACVATSFTAAKSDHTHTLSSGSVGATGSTTTVSASSHTHTGTAAATSSNTATVSTSSHVHTGTASATGNTTTVSASAHTHTGTAASSAGESSIDVASSAHVHQGPTDAANIGEGMSLTVLDSSHTHSIGSKSITVNEPWTNEIDNEEAWTSPINGVCTPLPCGSSPEMYLTVKIDGTQITGSPFVIGVEGEYTYNEEEEIDELSGSISKTSISDIVTTSGDHTVELSLSNKTSPGEDCRCRLTVNVNGRYYIQSITS